MYNCLLQVNVLDIIYTCNCECMYTYFSIQVCMCLILVARNDMTWKNMETSVLKCLRCILRIKNSMRRPIAFKEKMQHFVNVCHLATILQLYKPSKKSPTGNLSI